MTIIVRSMYNFVNCLQFNIRYEKVERPAPVGGALVYHYMSWTLPSWCNLKLQQCSINIIQTLHSVCIHIEDVHLLLWADLTIYFLNFLYVELSHFLSLYDIDCT